MTLQYTSILSMGINNHYFNDGVGFDPNLIVVPTHATNKKLKNRGLLLKKVNNRAQILIGESEGTLDNVKSIINKLLEDHIQLRFKIKVSNPDFYRYVALKTKSNKGEFIYAEIGENIAPPVFETSVHFQAIVSHLRAEIEAKAKDKLAGESLEIEIIPISIGKSRIKRSITHLAQLSLSNIEEGFYQFKIDGQSYEFTNDQGSVIKHFYVDPFFNPMDEVGLISLSSYDMFLGDNDLPISFSIPFETQNVGIRYHLTRKHINPDVFLNMSIESNMGRFVQEETGEQSNSDTRTFYLVDEGGQLKGIPLLIKPTLKAILNDIDGKKIMDLPLPSLQSLSSIRKSNNSNPTAEEVLFQANLFIYL